MGKKQSSFNMGYEFNSYGDKVYIKADTSLAPQISQKNVQLTPDYSSYALKVGGGNAAVLNPENVDIQAMTMLGSQASVNNISLTKNEVGVYNVDFKVATSGLTDNPTKTSKGKDESKIHYVWYFGATGTTNLTVRAARSKMANEVAKVSLGGAIKVEYSGDYIVSGPTEDDSEAYNWVKVRAINLIQNKKNWKEAEEKEGWVPRIYVREDIKKTIGMKKFNNIFVSWVRINEKTVNSKSGNACKQWCSFKTQDINSQEVCGQTNGRWHVQVGPSVLDWEYPTNGSLGREEELKGFIKYIDVYLSLKTPDKNKPQERILKCLVKGLKAHTFCYYPYDESDKNYKLNKDASFFKSTLVTRAMADVCPGIIDPGFVQTGIRYPNADNGSLVSEKNIDFSIIEFFGGPNTKFGFTLSDYLLEKIVVNDDTITPNTRGINVGDTI